MSRLAQDGLYIAIALEEIEHSVHDRKVRPEAGELARASHEELRFARFRVLNLVVDRVDDSSHKVGQISAAESLILAGFVPITPRNRGRGEEAIPRRFVNKTNRQLQDAYGSSFGGRLLPAEAVPVPGIVGGRAVNRGGRR